METIKNYLETMFRNLPNTDQVIKAKQELLQMMEDKYSELISEGMSENAAVGTVISEFGNLDELAQTLGLESILNSQKSNKNKRDVSLDEVKEYFKAKNISSILKGLSIFFFITCVTPTILADNHDTLGVGLLFAFIGLGIALSIVSKSFMEPWDFLKKEPCSVSPQTIDFVVAEKKRFNTPYSIMHAIGVIFCALCFVPEWIVSTSSFSFLEELSGALIFFSVGIGVFLLVYSKKRFNAYKTILSLNEAETIGGNYANDASKNNPVYKNKKVQTIMDVYWSTITCIYLCYSFLTFDWHISWLIWPIAGVIAKMIKNIYGDENNE